MVVTDLVLLAAFLAPLMQCFWFRRWGKDCSPMLVAVGTLGAVAVCAAAAWAQGVLSPGWPYMRGVLALPGAVVLCLLIARLYRHEVRLRDAMESTRRLLGVVQAQERRFQTLKPQMEELKRVRHDIRHCLFLLNQMSGLGERDIADLAQYVELLDARLGGTLAEGELSVLGVLVRSYEEMAAAKGISTDIQLELEERGGVALPDLCIVMSNLLENAVEAVAREAGGGVIRVRTDNRPSWISIVVGNTFTGRFSPRNKRYPSSKQAGRYGVGLESVVQVAERYGGKAEFSAVDGMFLASVFLTKPEALAEEATCAAMQKPG